MSTFTNAYDEKVRPLMDKIDEIRSLLPDGMDGITFPTVVVVGDQSSGKSTLLESLSLVELPKGSGIVTRCPLVLRLRNSKVRRVYRLLNDAADGNGKFLLDEKNLNVMTYIEDETRKLAGTNKNVVKDLIELLVEDPNVRDLTVVDLPGIARNPIADQPTDIHAQTTNLIRHFIRPQGSVILCVFPANVDVATVESFTLAREVDPTGIRTIGVITKSDLAPSDDVLCEQLLMEKKEVLQLKLGFVAVRNRATNENMDLKHARKREKEFFRNHVASSKVGWHCLGIEGLINRLSDLYADRVKETFPKMRQQIQMKVAEIRQELANLPPELDTPSARLCKYYELGDFYVENILKEQLSSSNGLINKLHEEFKKVKKLMEMHTSCILLSAKYREKVRTAMTTCFGEQLPNFLPEHLLKRLVTEKIDQMWKATKTLLSVCFNRTLKIVLADGEDVSKNSDLLFAKLLPAFRNIVTSYLMNQKEAVHDQLDRLISLEKQDPYTLNDSYMQSIDEFSKKMGSDNKDDEDSVDQMVLSIHAYWTVLVERFVDYVTLSIRAAFVFNVCVGVRERIRSVPMEQCDFVDSFLSEDAHTRARRNKIRKAHERLEKALAVIGDYTVGGVANEVMHSCLLPIEDDLDALISDFDMDRGPYMASSKKSTHPSYGTRPIFATQPPK